MTLSTGLYPPYLPTFPTIRRILSKIHTKKRERLAKLCLHAFCDDGRNLAWRWPPDCWYVSIELSMPLCPHRKRCEEWQIDVFGWGCSAKHNKELSWHMMWMYPEVEDFKHTPTLSSHWHDHACPRPRAKYRSLSELIHHYIYALCLQLYVRWLSMTSLPSKTELIDSEEILKTKRELELDNEALLLSPIWTVGSKLW